MRVVSSHRRPSVARAAGLVAQPSGVVAVEAVAAEAAVVVAMAAEAVVEVEAVAAEAAASDRPV
jgi:hypothetical protein